MKNMHLLGLVSLLSSLAACTASTSPEPSDRKDAPLTGEQQDEKKDDGEAAGEAPGNAPGNAPESAPGNAPSAPACTPLPATPSGNAPGGGNPATKYCADLGYQVAADGTCSFPDGSTCDAWDFWRGACGGAYSFCGLHGGTASKKTEDMGGWTAEYALCTFPDGRSCKDSDFAATCTCN